MDVKNLTMKNESHECCYKEHLNKNAAIYSICITNYNSIDTIKSSMESIFRQVNSAFEIVVCDNFSNDGSQGILKEYAQNGKINLIVKRSSRGKGRQIAFENSIGKYIISGVDTDDRLKNAFHSLISIYHRNHEGYMLSADTIHIIPRDIVSEIGGWRDLNWGEDVDFCRRAKSLGKQHELGFSIDLVDRGDNKRSLLFRLKERYESSKSYYQIGKSVSDQVKMAIWFQKPVILLLAIFTSFVCNARKIKKFLYIDSNEDR